MWTIKFRFRRHCTEFRPFRAEKKRYLKKRNLETYFKIAKAVGKAEIPLMVPCFFLLQLAVTLENLSETDW